MNNQKLEKWGQKANMEYAGIVRKMNKGRGMLWNVFQTGDIVLDCDVLLVGLNPRNGTNMDEVAIRDENGKVKQCRSDNYAADFTHIRGILGGQWISQKALAEGFDGYMRTKNLSEVYQDFFDWKILKGLRFGDPNSFFTKIVKRGSWNLINYYPFGTNNEDDLMTELRHLSVEDKRKIRDLNLELYDILNPKLIVFLGIGTLNTVIGNGPSPCGVCQKEKSMYVGEIANLEGTVKRNAISICHTSRHWLTDEENQKIASLLGIEVGNLNFGEKSGLKAQIVEEVFNTLVNNLGEKHYLKAGCNGKTYMFQINDIIQIRITKAEKGYIGIRHANYDGKKKYNTGAYVRTDEYRNKLRVLGFKVDFKDSEDVWLGRKSFAKYGSVAKEIAKAIESDIDVLEKELGEY